MIVFIGAITLLVLGIFGLLINLGRARARIELLVTDNARFEANIGSLTEYVQKIEAENAEAKTHVSKITENLYQLKTELELKTQEKNEFAKRVSDWDKSRQEAINHAKAAIFETASELSQRLINAHKTETKETSEKLSATTVKLQEQFESIVNNIAVLNSEVKSSQATVEHVKQALLSPAGAGNLAEITLENILKASGLEPNRDFIMQYSFDLKSTGKRLRPDAVVFLPNNNIMIIDSKASKYFVEMSKDLEVDTEIPEKLKTTMRNHIRNLASKDYQESLLEFLHHKKINHASSLMFLPTESALEKLTQLDPDFMRLAWEKDILPVGPSGLIHILIYAKSQIALTKQSENQLAIIEEVKKLLHSLFTLYEHAKKVGDGLYSASMHFDKFAASFNANLLPKARKLEKLGVHLQKNKAVPASMDRFTVLVSSKTDLIEVEQVTPDEKSAATEEI